MSEFTVPIAGLHCQGCVNTVTEEISELDGVSSVTIELVTDGISQVHVVAENPIADDVIQSTLDEVGNFQVTR